ncbi:hypothetical protein [Corynebacterium glutamicum]|uniref:hypothetical protein n=1 Tax=Corynebacterium glutamicum TaxID=1718 RepID=UPI0009449C15|nr:hypothetical protein [Corynebacterium glutamicum]OKX84269.1 hypothetical protein AUO95_03535 [Corynebacterium glutamicum]
MTINTPSMPCLTDSQKGRSASATIAGYLYQFERSVVELLNLDPGQKLRVEGIEDIDIWSNSPSVVQVKYFEAKKWSLSVVRDAVYELLKSFASGLEVSYVLYIHCGIGDPPPSILNLESLKQCLTYRPREKPVKLLYEDFKEEQLIDFLSHFKISSGVTLKDQQKLTTSAIAKALHCDEDEAEALHRMRAVQYLHEIALKKDENERVVTKEDLLNRLNDREIFYSRWHKEAVGKERFVSAICKKLKDAQFNIPTKHRGILLQVTRNNLDAVCRLSEELALDMNGVEKKRTIAAKPWTLILQGEGLLITEVKKFLIQANTLFNDGFESIQFSPQLFVEPAIVRGQGKSDRLLKSSHSVRIVSEDSMKDVLETDHKLDRLIVLIELREWHKKIVKANPIQVHEISVDEITEIIRRVTR